MRPYGITKHGDLFVTFYDCNCIIEYEVDGDQILIIGDVAEDPANPAEGELAYAFGIASDDYLYTTDAGSPYVTLHTYAGAFQSRFELQGSAWGRGIALTPTQIAVVTNQDTVQVFNRSGVHQFSFGSNGSGPGNFDGPIGIWYYDGCFFVADTGNNRIQAFDSSDGTFLYEIGATGSSLGHFNAPVAVTVDADGLYVLEQGNSRIQWFENHSAQTGTADYEALGFLGYFGAGNGQLNQPFGMTMDDNFLYVADTMNDRVQIFWRTITLDAAVGDVLPQAVTGDILCNDLYGLGLNRDEMWDAAAATESARYCQDNDMYISPVFDSQVSVLDALQHVISHHDGFITYINGIVAHHQLKIEIPVRTLTHDDLVKEKKKLPIGAAGRAPKDYKNRVNIEYTKRAKDYVSGVATADDVIDIDRYGVMDVSMNLDALTTWVRAMRMAYRQLRRLLLPAQTYQFKLGLKNLDLRPGQVVNFTDPTLELENQPIRIGSVSERKDFQIEVDATDDNPLVNTFVYSPGVTTTSTSTNTIGTGTKVFTVPAGLGIAPGGTIHISATVNSSCWMEGSVVSYDATTLTVDIERTGGSGTFSSWDISYIPSIQPEIIAPDADPGSVLHPMVFRIPAIYSAIDYVGVAYSKSAELAWNGANLYKAYADGGPYSMVGTRYASGITGVVLGVNEASPSSSPSSSPSDSPSATPSSSPSTSPSHSPSGSPSSSPSRSPSASPSHSPSSSVTPSSSNSASPSGSPSHSPSGSPSSSASSSPSSSPSPSTSPSHSPSTSPSASPSASPSSTASSSPSSSPSAGAGAPYIDILLDTDDTLSSATSFEDLGDTPMQNLFVIRTATGDKFCRFQQAELVAPRHWRLTDFIYDEGSSAPVDHSIGDIAEGDVLAFYSGGLFKVEVLPVDAGKTLYFKVQSFNQANMAEDLSTLSSISITV